MKGCPSLYLLTWRRDSSVFWVTAIFLEQGLLESTACWNLIEQTDDSSCISLPLGWREGQFWQRRWRRAWCEAAGPDKQSFAWPPVSVISQRESLISKKVVNLLASVCPCLLCQEGAKLIFWRNRGGLLLKCSLFSVWLFSCEDSSSVSVSLSLSIPLRCFCLSPSPLHTGTLSQVGEVFSLLTVKLGLLLQKSKTEWTVEALWEQAGLLIFTA